MKIRDDVEIGQHSHVGMARTENQDFFGYWEPDEDRLFDLKGRLAVYIILKKKKEIKLKTTTR